MLEFVTRSRMKFSREQCRAARALLKMKQTELASAAGVSVSTVTDFELDSREVSEELILKMRVALELAGVSFDINGGVKLRPGRRH